MNWLALILALVKILPDIIRGFKRMQVESSVNKTVAKFKENNDPKKRAELISDLFNDRL